MEQATSIASLPWLSHVVSGGPRVGILLVTTICLDDIGDLVVDPYTWSFPLACLLLLASCKDG